MKLTRQPNPALRDQPRAGRLWHDWSFQQRVSTPAWEALSAEAELADDDVLGAFAGIAWSSLLGGSFWLLVLTLVLAS